jgi:hypothetical protein
MSMLSAFSRFSFCKFLNNQIILVQTFDTYVVAVLIIVVKVLLSCVGSFSLDRLKLLVNLLIGSLSRFSLKRQPIIIEKMHYNSALKRLTER